MTVDLRERLAKANELRTPELWDEIELRVARGTTSIDIEVAHHVGGRQRLVAGIVAFAVFALAGGFGWTAFRSTRQIGEVPGVPTPPGWLVEKARFMADSNLDPNPTSARWVLTDSRTAAPAVGLTPDQANGAPEYLVVLEGNFVAGDAKVPTGADPTGTTLVFTLDPDTHEVKDWGVGNQAVDVPGLVPFELGTDTSASPSLETEPSLQGDRLAAPYSYDDGAMRFDPPSDGYVPVVSAAAAMAAFEQTGLYADKVVGENPQEFLANYTSYQGATAVSPTGQLQPSIDQQPV